jgi:RNA polymerase sigma factor (sigma-70 family)
MKLMGKELENDQVLLEAFVRNADTEAFSEIVCRHSPMVYRVCFRILADHHESEDAAQAVFLVLMRKAASIRNRHSLGSWLHGVARTTALYALRGHSRRREREEEAAMCSDLAVQMHGEDGTTSALMWLDDALGRLSERQREAVVLRHLEGRSINDAARLIGCTPETLAGRTRDGISALRSSYAKRGVAFTGALLAAMLDGEAQAAVPATLQPSIMASSHPLAGAVGNSVIFLTKGTMKMMLLQSVTKVAVVVGMFLVVGGVSGGLAYAAKEKDAEARPAELQSQDWETRVDAHIEAKEYDKAEAILEQVVRDNPDMPSLDRALMKWAVVAYRMENYNRSLEKCHQLMEKFPQSALVVKARDMMKVISKRAEDAEVKRKQE